MGPILLNCFFNHFYYFIKNANVHNFADDNALTTSAQYVRNLISVLESKSNIATDWFETNKMIANPCKFQSINLISIYILPVFADLQQIS